MEEPIDKVRRLRVAALQRLERLRGMPETERRRRRVARLLGLVRAWGEMMKRFKAGEN